MRLIDADALRKQFEEVYPLSTNEMGCIINKGIYEIIDNAPTVTPDMAQVLAYECEKASKERPTGERSGLADIRWTDKVSIDADGNIRDFDGTILYSMRNEYGEEKKND